MSFKLYSKPNSKSRRKSYPQYQPIPKSIDREFKLTLDVFDTKEDCPARIRPNWPKEIIPWWTPSHANEKPPYSYATLIAHAILTSQEGRLTLNDIYLWISDHYKAYSIGVGGWQNSIRHNLSLNKKWFQRIERKRTQASTGKGSFWTLVPGAEQVFLENLTQENGTISSTKKYRFTPSTSLSSLCQVASDVKDPFYTTFRLTNKRGSFDSSQESDSDEDSRPDRALCKRSRTLTRSSSLSSASSSPSDLCLLSSGSNGPQAVHDPIYLSSDPTSLFFTTPPVYEPLWSAEDSCLLTQAYSLDNSFYNPSHPFVSMSSVL
ncbi:hypothetical protein G6F66_009463 [Rhizopus arrhizus]|nr:hypothetical protein G6F66_009463 [Rhizopus arrhizus]